MVPGCTHVWITNSGHGGEPDFSTRYMGRNVMHVRCESCSARTWFTRVQWAALPREGESRAARRRREREVAKLQQAEERYQAHLEAAHRREYERTGRTYWNGEGCEARRVVVVVGKSERPTWWCAELEGQRRRAVEVTYVGQVFLLDDEDGSGWAKVTVGRGSPGYGHKSLPPDSVVVEEIDG